MRLSVDFIRRVLREDPEKSLEGGIETLTGSPKQNKLHAIPTRLDGYKFDSRLESRRYSILRLWEQAGIITNLDLEHKKIGAKNVEIAKKHRWVLQDAFVDEQGRRHRAITYTDDFQYEIDGALIVEDCKGFCTASFLRSQKMLLKRYPSIRFFVNTKKDGWYLDTLKEQ